MWGQPPRLSRGAKRVGPRKDWLASTWQALLCDAKMYHMKKASVRDLRYEFKKVERLLHQGEQVQITKRRRVIARLIPDGAEAIKRVPDFLARLRTIYGDKVLAVSGADLISSDRSRY
jgi:antitoxin (DNA-binding transcriptional repressor) of toxin-antitoxin stability system